MGKIVMKGFEEENSFRRFLGPGTVMDSQHPGAEPSEPETPALTSQDGTPGLDLPSC